MKPGSLGPARLSVLFLFLLGLAVTPGAAAEPRGTPGGSYRLVRGDRIRVIVWGEDNLDLGLRVRPDGFVTLPMIHDVRAAGLTPEDLARIIADRLSAYIKQPDVAVIVEEATAIEISVLGEVNAQGTYRFYQQPTLLQVLAAAGGLTPVARGKVVIIRHSPDAETRRRINLAPLLHGDADSPDPHLTPGDIVVVQ